MWNFKVYYPGMLIERPRVIERITAGFHVHPAVALTGPRQCGKTTLAHMLAQAEPVVAIFDLEKAVDRRRLEAPEQALSSLAGLVVIDEIQRQPPLYETLRVLVDRPGNAALSGYSAKRLHAEGAHALA